MKKYVVITICILLVLPVLRVLSYWYSALIIIAPIFILCLLWFSNKHFARKNTEIIVALALGFSYFCLVSYNSLYYPDHFMIENSFAFSGGWFIRVPEFIERLFNIPGTYILFAPAGGILGAICSTAAMLVVDFIRKRLSQHRAKSKL